MSEQRGDRKYERPECCGTCRFWEHVRDDRDDDDPEIAEGVCHRFPPALNQVRMKYAAEAQEYDLVDFCDDAEMNASYFTQPATHAGEWCGEWQRHKNGRPTEETVAVPAQLLDKSIRFLEFTGRTRNSLEGDGISTVGELTERTVASLMDIRQFGDKMLGEVVSKLAAHGLALRSGQVVTQSPPA